MYSKLSYFNYTLAIVHITIYYTFAILGAHFKLWKNCIDQKVFH